MSDKDGAEFKDLSKTQRYFVIFVAAPYLPVGSAEVAHKAGSGLVAFSDAGILYNGRKRWEERGGGAETGGGLR